MTTKLNPQTLSMQTLQLSAKVTRLAGERGKTVGTAESCTGGLIGAALTSVQGSSAVFHGGIIAYDNAVKANSLNVSHGLLTEFGAVSSEVAAVMAREARARLNVDIAVSVTGIAGPGGGSKEKPVGTVWMGLACRANGSVNVSTQHYFFDHFNRQEVREMTVMVALETLINALKQ